MKKSNLIFLLLFCLVSCSQDISPVIVDKSVSLILEESNDYKIISNSTQKVNRGEDATFTVKLDGDGIILDCSYRNYQVIYDEEKDEYNLLLKNIEYPSIVQLFVTYNVINYNGNGGYTKEGKDIYKVKANKKHLRENAINNPDVFKKEDHVLIGFNTEKDGSGEHIGFGSRIPYNVENLYCEWKKETSLNDFIYSNNENKLVLESYIGEEKNVVIPISKGDVVLSDYLFKNKTLDSLVLPNRVRFGGNNTFDESTIKELYIFDTNTKIPGESLDKCSIEKVHINAGRNPTYSGTYYDLFQDKMDYLYKIKENRKFILFGGSSVRYGYDSMAIMDAFPDYNVVNMGVYAYVNAKPQIEIITKFMSESDYLIHSPEFENHALYQQFCMTNKFEFNEFALFESNYEMLSMLNIQEYPTFFKSFVEFLESRVDMFPKNYSYQAKKYDDDGNYNGSDLYNIYGDMTMFRTGHPIPNERISQDWCDFTVHNVTPKAIESLNTVYDNLKEQGINVLFTYFPKNRYCLSVRTNEDTIKELEEEFNSLLHVPVISKIDDYIYDANYFYLIDNHLSSEGAMIRTERVINDLKNYGIR